MTGRLADLRSSTSALLLGLDDDKWSDGDMRAPSLLPGWTRGHVLTHIARNADSISRTVSGALRGEIVKRYPGGHEQRVADIETGAGRSASEIFADVRESAERLDRLFAAVAESDEWNLECDNRTAGEYVLTRWRELEVHRVDAAGSYGPADWPPAFVSLLVPELVDGLAGRSQAALRIEVDSNGSITTDLPGSVWQIGTGEEKLVNGPDWAIAAWLAGRPDAVGDVLSAMPPLERWI